jgi:hypothetical protein
MPLTTTGASKRRCLTDNFAADLFQGYDMEDLPCTNNELEHCFASHGFMSDEPRADGEPFLASWSVGPFALLLLSSRHRDSAAYLAAIEARLLQ